MKIPLEDKKNAADGSVEETTQRRLWVTPAVECLKLTSARGISGDDNHPDAGSAD